MDSSQSSLSSVTSDVDERNIATVNHILEELFKAMHGGWFAEWADTYLSDDVVLIENGALSGVNRVFKGRIEICEFYNQVLSTVWGAKSLVSWTQEHVYVGEKKGQVEAIMKQVVQQPGDRETVKRKKYEFELSSDGTRLRVLNCRILGVVSATFTAASPPSFDRPCSHNNWDSIRVKRKLCQLRCRICLGQWKLRAENVNRCPVFVEPGCTDANCKLLHINKKKLRVAMSLTPQEGTSSE
eukprot:TRINITY_DN2534_c0_g1_i1.p1 TRINITY_DN2534_c0_g1~~TRINITY_DN2534_c0_g1_i1.p1  ORF type:complete len:241 (+),score=32.59 TRINITY_DN2534_c0_g1_i1:52-774(+)